MVHAYLVKQFNQCIVKSNGVEGIDHRLINNEKTIFLETKTCKPLIRGNIVESEEYMYYQKSRLGRFKFSKIQCSPYNKSQHEDLVDTDGWYIFVVGNTIYAGKAKDVDRILNKWIKYKRITWDKVLCVCYPNWVDLIHNELKG